MVNQCLYAHNFKHILMRNDIEFIIIRISNKMSSIHKPCKTHLHSKSVVHIDISLNEDMKTYIYGTVFLVIKIEI